jgi:hypothetical protein
MEAIANMLIATFDLFEAEGRALHRRLIHLGIAAALALVGLLVALVGVGCILIGLYLLLARQMPPPEAALIFGAAALVLSGGVLWFVRTLIR